MIKIQAKVKKWGNSLGIIIPKDLANQINIKPAECVDVTITKKNVSRAKDMFGLLKNWKKPTEEIMKEVDKELDSKFFKRKK